MTEVIAYYQHGDPVTCDVRKMDCEECMKTHPEGENKWKWVLFAESRCPLVQSILKKGNKKDKWVQSGGK